MFELNLKTHKKTEFIEITDSLQELVQKSMVKEGHLFVYTQHTTAAILSNENANGGAIWKDIGEALEKIAPQEKEYHHDDGNAHSHIKGALIGNSKTFFIHQGQIVLGTWEGIYLAEFDGPRQNRRILVKITESQ
ncbi:secondary thiamine-phosphate synthase enzyme YjbQ [Candidatus Micrarchaeota archaeon]|nr:secondary thiamine-phosphate synthase enzyme YjbQ [Candidatus Micrarchaeota archaeon]MBU1930591.1 secondary thiamine-phosphate synthase enzyme YjbQ [Candidatus Micrarchaeota archaeon]